MRPSLLLLFLWGFVQPSLTIVDRKLCLFACVDLTHNIVATFVYVASCHFILLIIIQFLSSCKVMNQGTCILILCGCTTPCFPFATPTQPPTIGCFPLQLSRLTNLDLYQQLVVIFAIVPFVVLTLVTHAPLFSKSLTIHFRQCDQCHRSIVCTLAHTTMHIHNCTSIFVCKVVCHATFPTFTVSSA